MSRDKYPTRSLILRGNKQVDTAVLLIKSAPIDYENPLEIIIREQVKKRKPDQNALYWVGPLKDISEQAYLNGRTFSPEIWHEYFKDQFLPEPNLEDAIEDYLHVKEPGNYKKYDYLPDGQRFLVGSTTDLSVKGFAIYLEKIYAYGANLGVMFRANPAEESRYAA